MQNKLIYRTKIFPNELRTRDFLLTTDYILAIDSDHTLEQFWQGCEQYFQRFYIAKDMNDYFSGMVAPLDLEKTELTKYYWLEDKPLTKEEEILEELNKLISKEQQVISEIDKSIKLGLSAEDILKTLKSMKVLKL